MSTRKSPAMEKAFKYLEEHKGAGVTDLMENGVSRATAFKAIKAVKNSEFAIEHAVKERGETKSATTPKPAAEPKKKPVCRGVVPYDEIPEHLRKKPGLTLEGFSLKQQSNCKPGEVVWSDKVYVGACPVCTGPVNMFKKMADRKPFYEGPCKKCGIKVLFMV